MAANNNIREAVNYSAEKSFGKCLFISLDHEREGMFEDGSEGIEKRFYLLYSERQEEQIRVGIDASVPVFDFPRKTPVFLTGIARVTSVPEQNGRESQLNNYIDVEGMVKAEVGAQAPSTPKPGTGTPGATSQPGHGQSNQGEKK